MANGHPKAPRYPAGKVFMEAEFVVERLNRDLATQFTLMQLTIGSVFNKKSGGKFTKTIKDLGGN